jgi:DNA repair exonuclease SbcCD ATPase subunit
MTTFPQDLHIRFKKGINVIFGGNYSGKTTIINSLRYGIFGLSWGHRVENIEKRYFASRVKEIGRKSLDIDLIYYVRRMTMNVHRTVFSSGSADIEAKVSKGSGKSISALVANINHQKEYADSLSKYMGLLTEGQLRSIPNLIFADEDRKPILWVGNLEDFILGLLTSSENASKLQWIESQITKVKNNLDKLHQDRDQISRKISDNKRIQEFLSESLRKIKEIGIEKYAKEYKKTELELQRCRNELTEINNKLQAKLTKKSGLLSQLEGNQRTLLDLKAHLDKLETDFVKATLNPDDPKEVQIVRNLYYGRKCPLCLSDLSTEIDHRKEQRLCYLCGKGRLTAYKVDKIQKINQEVLNLNNKENELCARINGLQVDLNTIDSEIEKITKSSREGQTKSTKLSARITELKGIEENLHRKEVVSKDLEDMQTQINNNLKLVAEIEDNIDRVTSEIEKANQLYDKTKTAMRIEIDSALGKIREKFSRFVDLATSSEVTGELSPNFIPKLNGRSIYYPESVSQFERTIMDYAFRISLLSTFAESTKTYPSLAIETPDEVADESYIPHLAKAIQDFSSNLSIIITTVDTEMMKCLLSNYKRSDRKKRLIDLISKGTLTQRKFYQRPLYGYLSG